MNVRLAPLELAAELAPPAEFEAILSVAAMTARFAPPLVFNATLPEPEE